MTVCMYRDINTLKPYIIDFTQRGCHTLRLEKRVLPFPGLEPQVIKPIALHYTD